MLECKDAGEAPATMATNSNAISKKIRSEYMKKFREPKWETFSKCYQDSLRYRISRRLMEQAHRPLFQDSWDTASDSSGGSSSGHRAPAESEYHDNSSGSRDESTEGPQRMNGDAGGSPAKPGSLPIENGYEHPPENGPSALGVKPRRRAPRSEPAGPWRRPTSDDSTDTAAPRNPDRARSQPPVNTKPRGQDFERLHWAVRNLDVRDRRRTNMKGSASAGEIHRADVGVQTRRESDKRGKALDRRRARSADLEKLRRVELTPVKDCWITEYMRCFSARLR